MKSALRQEIKKRKAQFSKEELKQRSNEIQCRILQHPRWEAADTIYLYAALPDEVDTSMLLHEALAAKKTLLLPRVEGKDLLWIPVCRLEDLEEGAYHILEPTLLSPTHEENVENAVSPLAIIPGVAFTTDGKRLGRGKGFYDRTLAQHPELYTVGICWQFQLLEDIPTEPHDIRMKEVICG